MWIWCNWKNGWNFQWVRVGSNIAYCSTNYTLNALCVRWSLSLPPLPLLPHWLGTCSKCSKVSCCSEPSLIPGNRAVLSSNVTTHSNVRIFLPLYALTSYVPRTGRGKQTAPIVGNLITSVLRILHSCTLRCIKAWEFCPRSYKTLNCS